MNSQNELTKVIARAWTKALIVSLFGGMGIVVLVTLATPSKLAMAERIDSLSRAEQFIGARKYRWAAKLLDEIDQEGLDPWERKRVRLQKGLCAMGLGDHAGALALFMEDVSGFEPIKGYVSIWEAKCFEAIDKPDSATSRFESILAGDFGKTIFRQATFRAATHLEGQSDYSAAADIYQTLLDNGTRSATAVLGIIRALEATGDSSQAARLQLRLIRDYPSSKEALEVVRVAEPLIGEKEIFYGAVCYARHRKYRTAARLLKGLVKSPADRAWKARAQYELGKVYYSKRDYRAARLAFRKAYKIYKVPKGLLEEARCDIRLGSDLEGARRFESFAKTFPSIAGAAEGLWQAAMAYERRGHSKNAGRVFEELSRKYSKSDYAEQGLWRAGYLQFKRRQYEEAARSFLVLANRTKEKYLRDQGYYWAGKCYHRLDRDDEWEFWLGRASEGFPASYYSARARAVLGKVDSEYPYIPEDAKVIEKQLDYVPTSALVRGDLLAALGLYRDAAAEYASTESSYVTNRFALNDLLQRYERINAMDRALRVSNYLLNVERDSGVPMSVASFRRLYPTYYWGSVYKSAQETNLDPNLILAIMRQESAFNRKAMSTAGARGLMQLMPATGRDMARKVRVKGFKVEDLWQANISIRLGSEHLSDHMEYFSKSDESRQLGLALSAYNAGLAPARRWSKRLPQDDVDEFVESIPYRETRNYVKLVYRNYQVYSYLQDGEPGDIEKSFN